MNLHNHNFHIYQVKLLTKLHYAYSCYLNVAYFLMNKQFPKVSINLSLLSKNLSY